MVEMLMPFQSLFSYFKPAWLPFVAMIFSLLNSWHCSVMCGPLVGDLIKRSTNRTFLFRIIAYTTMGALFGAFGKELKDSLELEVIGIFSFLIFAAISVLGIGPMFFPVFKKISPIMSLFNHLSQLRGLLWGFVPCHLLLFYYGMAVLSTSVLSGAMLLFIHGVMTTPILIYTRYFGFYLQRWHPFKYLSFLFKYLLLALVLFNLYSFGKVAFQGNKAQTNGPIICR